ncbi:hypothetical protein [Halovivax sp.]|uniref:DUF7562 family protein n=1 Tax=Halovivax sp. TaxID=1935978 RepID=UPI0025B8EECD|nr:hypothetical protein [Halovivax sp.]
MRLPWRKPETVRCLACDERVLRDDAREYDKYGDRWDREGKSFEHFCKPCDRTRCRRSRDGVEARLVEAGAGEVSRAAFLARLAALQGPEDGRVTER